jgi:hypothetical protein
MAVFSKRTFVYSLRAKLNAFIKLTLEDREQDAATIEAFQVGSSGRGPW